MDTAPPPNDPLRQHLSGKRRWSRLERPYLVELRGPRRGFMGQVLDLSPGGLRVAIVDPSFYEGTEDGFALVTLRFPRGATVCFVEAGMSRETRIVRITPHGDHWLSLGCEFEKRLTKDEAVRLGVTDESIGGEDASHVIEVSAED